METLQQKYSLKYLIYLISILTLYIFGCKCTNDQRKFLQQRIGMRIEDLLPDYLLDQVRIFLLLRAFPFDG